MSSNLDMPQIIQDVHAGSDNALQVKGIGGVLVTEKFDYVSAAYPNATTEVFTYKVGGAGGTVVATVTIVYTDSTKADLSTVTKV